MSSLNADSPLVYLDVDLAVAQIGDAGALPGMLGLLEESLARDIPKISQLLTESDIVGVNRLLHPMKGFLPIFCGDALCAELARVEILSKHGTIAVVAQAYGELRPKLELLLSDVATFLHAPRGAD